MKLSLISFAAASVLLGACGSENAPAASAPDVGTEPPADPGAPVEDVAPEADPGSPTPDLPPSSCDGALWEGACVAPGGTGDSLGLVGAFDGHSFVEILDVEHLDGYVFMCTGTKGLAIYDAPADGPPTFIVHRGALGQGSHAQYPRCQHIAFGEVGAGPAGGDVSVFVTNRGDETQPQPWIKWVRFEGGLGALEPSYQGYNLPVVTGVKGDTSTSSYEGIAYQDGLLYATMHSNGLAVFDTAEDKLTQLGVVPTNGNAWDVKAHGDLLIVATSDNGIQTFSLADPKLPEWLGGAASLAAPTRLAVQGDTVFAATGHGGLEIFDISDPKAPTRIREVATAGTAMDVNVSGDHVVVAGWEDLRVFDVSDPKAPWLVAAETVTTKGAFSRVLTADISDGSVFVGEWTALLTYTLDPAQTPADIRVLQSELQFGAGAKAKALVVANEGWMPLTITAADFNAPGYTISPTEATIAPQEAVAFEVFLDASIPGPSELRLHSNDPDEATARVAVGPPPSGGAIGPGDSLPSQWSFVDNATGQPVNLQQLTKGKVTLLAYFATF